VVHLASTPLDEAPGLSRCAGLEKVTRELDKLAHRAQTLMRKLRIEPGDFAPEPSEEIFAPLLAERPLDVMEREVAGVVSALEATESEMQEIQRTTRELEGLDALGVPVEQIPRFTFLHFALGEATGEQMTKLKRLIGRRALVLPYGSEGDKERFVAVTDKKGRFALATAIEKSEASPKEIDKRHKGFATEILSHARDRQEALQAEEERRHAALDAFRQKYGAQLVTLANAIETERSVVTAEENYAKTRKTFIINGWVPADRLSKLVGELTEATKNHIVIEATDPGDEEPPVLLRNHPWLQPFASLVMNYDMPNYKEIVPTLFAAIAFLLMFGLMFGDIGHGSVLILLGLGLLLKGRTDALRQGGRLFIMAGAAACVFGLLYGSIFGREDLVKALWLTPIAKENTMHFLLITVFFGVGLISLGIVLSIINRFLSRDYFHAILDKTGLVGALFYWGAVGLAIKAALLGTASVRRGEVLLLIILPLAILFLREPIYAIITRRDKIYHEGAVTGIMEALVELMETITSYLANTISFVRVGAFALAHAGLFIAIFALERMVRGPHVVTVGSVLVLVLGNALAIGLEGLVVVIQVLRLEYYEFFGKFFVGGGKRYEPFTTP